MRLVFEISENMQLFTKTEKGKACIFFNFSPRNRKKKLNEVFSIKLPIVRKLINKEKTEKILKALNKAKIPFAFEVSVGNLGKSIEFYIILPSSSKAILEKAVLDVLPEAQIKQVHGNNIFSIQGVTESAYFLIKPDSKNYLNRERFLTILQNLTKINTFHEGAAVQLIFKEGDSDYEIDSNFRIVASAGAEMRAKEILDSFSKSLKDFRATKIKSHKFLEKFANYGFDKTQSFKMHKSQITNFFHL